jgi:hypothetical protein
MRILMVLLPLALAGCQSPAPQAAALPVKTAPVVAPPRPLVPPPERSSLERRQAQWIEALISQNDALQQRLAAAPTVTARSEIPTASSQPVREMPAAGPKPETLACIEPDAQRVVDLTAPATAPGEPVNPFAVREPAASKGRELALVVSGIVAGPDRCAVINERLVQPGDPIDVLRLEEIEAGAVFLGYGDQRIRLTVSETPVRVRLPN